MELFILEETHCCVKPGSVLFFQICQDSQLEKMPNTDSRNIWRRVIQQIQTSEHKNVYFMRIFLCCFAP